MQNDAIILKIDLFDNEFCTINESKITAQMCNEIKHCSYRIYLDYVVNSST